jgi:hypothetical protein
MRAPLRGRQELHDPLQRTPAEERDILPLSQTPTGVGGRTTEILRVQVDVFLWLGEGQRHAADKDDEPSWGNKTKEERKPKQPAPDLEGPFGSTRSIVLGRVCLCQVELEGGIPGELPETDPASRIRV